MATKSAQRDIEKQLIELQDLLSQQTPPFKDTSHEGTRKRHEQTRADDGLWMRTYTPHYVDSPDALFHRDLSAVMEVPDNVIIPVHGPREHAKSIRCRVNLMRRFCNGLLRYWVIGSEKVGLAWDHIEFIYTEFLQNRRILADYDIEIIKKDENAGKFRFKITCRATGKKNYCMLQAVSYETLAKGMVFMELRPQGALIDDFEGTRSSRNARIGKEKRDWVRQELYPACTGPVIWLGNIGRKTSALHQGMELAFEHEDDFEDLKKQGSVPGRIARKIRNNSGRLPEEYGPIIPLLYRADSDMEDGTVRLLWPERYRPEWYANKRATMGHLYEGEMNGDPRKPGTVFKNFPRFSRAELEQFGTGCVWWLWFDPAWGRTKHSAYKCWIAGCSDGSRFYAVKAYCRQGTAIDEALDAMYHAFDELGLFGLRDGGFEDAYDQEYRLRKDIEAAATRHGSRLPIYGYPNPGAKDLRIMSMEGLFNLGLWKFPERTDDDMQQVIEQLKEYPDSEYVDGPDALAGLTKGLSERARRIGSSGYQSLGKRRYQRTRR